MRSPVRTIAIVGGGFCGTVLATRLLRQPPEEPSRIVLIERREEVGRGVAYQPSPSGPLLNVPAGRMSADAADPLQFANFAHDRNPGVSAHSFLPRALYGEYLQQLLQQAQQVAPARVDFQRIRAEASALHRIATDGPYLLSLSPDQQLLADDVVLACGDPPPVDPVCVAGIAGHASYLGNPHCNPPLGSDCTSLLVIGAGLTMVDVALGAAAANPRIRIHAISRHGLLPGVQNSTPLPRSDGSESELRFMSHLGSGPISARLLLQGFRALCRELRQQGRHWRDAVTAAREVAPALWQRMPEQERSRFLRHLRVYWDVHRHRMPPSIEQRLRQLRRSGRLCVHAGRVLRMDAVGGAALQVRWRPRGAVAVRQLLVDQVINCAGTDHRLTRTGDPLQQAMMASGLAVADRLGLGWRTGPHGALIDADGRSARHLFYLGPMLRADHWEATAVAELRLHAQQLAAALVQIRA